MRKLVSYSLVLFFSMVVAASSFGQIDDSGIPTGGGSTGNGFQFIPSQGYTPVAGGTLEEVPVEIRYMDGWDDFYSYTTVPSFRLQGFQFASDGYYDIDQYDKKTNSLTETEISAFGVAVAPPLGFQHGGSMGRKNTNGSTARVLINGTADTRSRMFQTSGPISSAKANVAWRAAMPIAAKFGVVKVTTTLSRSSAGGHISNISARFGSGSYANPEYPSLFGVDLLEYPGIFSGSVCDVGATTSSQSLPVPVINSTRTVSVPFNANSFQTVSYYVISNRLFAEDRIRVSLEGSMFMPTGQSTSGYYSGSSAFEATIELELTCYSVSAPNLGNFPKIATPAP